MILVRAKVKRQAVFRLCLCALSESHRAVIVVADGGLRGGHHRGNHPLGVEGV